MLFRSKSLLKIASLIDAGNTSHGETYFAGGFKGASPLNKGHLVCYQMTYLLGQHRLSAALSAVGATLQPVSSYGASSF